MLDLTSTGPSLLDGYDETRNLIRSLSPLEFEEIRERGLRTFREFGLPTTRDEEFKYLPLAALRETHFRAGLGENVSRADLEVTTLGGIDAVTVTFVNGQYAPELSSTDVIPDGVFVGTLADATEQFPDKVLTHLGKVATLQGKLGTTNDERFVGLNNAFLAEGATVWISTGITLERTVHLVFVSAGQQPIAIYPRTLIVLEEGAQAKIIESHVGLGGQAFSCPVTEVVLQRASILEHTKLQEEAENSIHIANITVHQDSDSTYTSNNINFGGLQVRNDVNVWIDGEHTETWLNGVNLGFGNQIVDNHTRIDHAKPNCHSFETYKSILGGNAVGVFNGKIFVYLDAQKTDAKQTNQGILLSPTATFNTKPQLEIFADDVKCTHGATVGQLREDALFYLRARGIPKQEARALLVYAFAGEVLDKVTVADARAKLEEELFERLQAQN